ncbi:MAG: hypothetical protein QW129_05160, partial [Thermoplasmata archaeon]
FIYLILIVILIGVIFYLTNNREITLFSGIILVVFGYLLNVPYFTVNYLLIAIAGFLILFIYDIVLKDNGSK